MTAAGLPGVDPRSKPVLPRGVRLKFDEVRDQWMLLAPERMIKLNPVSVEILKLCTGDRDLAAIIDDLAKTFEAPRERISADVGAMLAQLVSKRLVDLR